MAQTDPLGSLVREGIRNNLSLEQHRLTLHQQEAAVREARGGFLPSLTFNARYSESNGTLNVGDLVNPAYRALNQITGTGQFPTDVDATLPLAQETKLSVVQPLFQPAIGANHRIQRSLRNLQGAALRTAGRQLAADIQTAYLQFASAVRVAELYRNTVPLLQENVRVNERLLEHGKVTPDALFRARAELSEAEQNLLEAEQRSDAARRALNLLLDRSLDAEVELLSDSLLTFPLEVTLDEALHSGLANREELEQVQASGEAARAQKRLAAAGWLPGVSLAVDYGVQGSDYRFDGDHDFAVASLVLQWTAFNGGQTSARRAQAHWQAERARTQRTELERQIALQVRQAFDAARVASAAISTAQDRLAAARRTFELVERRYQQGMASHIEYVDARTAYTTAGLNEILTRYQYAVRYVELERAAALREMEP